MMLPFDTDLMKYPASAHTAPTAFERQAARARRAARRAEFIAFVDKVFSHAPRHATPVTDSAIARNS